MSEKQHFLTDDSLFVLECGDIFVGHAWSHPGIVWRSGERNGALYCTSHKRWERLVDMVTVADV